MTMPLNQTEIIYTVLVNGHAVLATIAAGDMELIADAEASNELDRIVYIKAERKSGYLLMLFLLTACILDTHIAQSFCFVPSPFSCYSLFERATVCDAINTICSTDRIVSGIGQFFAHTQFIDTHRNRNIPSHVPANGFDAAVSGFEATATQ